MNNMLVTEEKKKEASKKKNKAAATEGRNVVIEEKRDGLSLDSLLKLDMKLSWPLPKKWDKKAMKSLMKTKQKFLSTVTEPAPKVFTTLSASPPATASHANLASVPSITSKSTDSAMAITATSDVPSPALASSNQNVQSQSGTTIIPLTCTDQLNKIGAGSKKVVPSKENMPFEPVSGCPEWMTAALSHFTT
ncbi:hypothetical protein H0H87_005129 [Tephrocybe sp. NHM501043]|nr:hypothetical protein H0H87_005129 [Tephrocybe sp. NHM501043]